MIGFTFLRVVIVYGSCMIYEHVSQSSCTGCGITCMTKSSGRI